MPVGEKLQALQVTGALADRLAMAVGYPATVYVMGVHTEAIQGPPMPAPYRPGTPVLPPTASASGAPGMAPPWCPPGPTPPMPPTPPCPPAPPSPPMMMGTAVVSGVLAFAGTDYVDMHVAPNNCPGYMEVLIPYNSIGMAVPGGSAV